MKLRILPRVAALSVSAALLLCPYSALAGSGQTLADRLEVSADTGAGESRLPYYSSLKQSLESENCPENTRVEVKGGSYSSFEGAAPSASDEDGIIFSEASESVSWQFDVDTGAYELEIVYRPLAGSVQPPKRSLYIDGMQTFFEQSSFTLPKHWHDTAAPRVNRLGDEVRVSSEEIDGVYTIRLCDSWGKSAEPLRFSLTKGVHTVTLGYISQDTEIISLALVSPDNISSYSTVKAGYTTSNASDKIRFEAEDYKHIEYKSDATISLVSNGDPSASPYKTSNVVLNTIGGASWYGGGQEIVWKFSVPEDGLYKLNLRVLQSYGDGLPVYRNIKINGKTPFSELLEYSFDYEKSLHSEVLSGEDGEPYFFELKKGENTLSMTAVLGEYTEVSETLIDTSRMLSQLIFDITMITGQNPDTNYDYGLENEITDLLQRLGLIEENVLSCAEAVSGISVKRSAIQNNLERIADEIGALGKKPSEIVQRMPDLNTALSDMSDYATALQSGYLAVDYIELLPSDARVDNPKATFFQKLYAVFANLAASFNKDYNAIGSVDGGDNGTGSLEVWVALGKEWGQIIRETVDSEFAPQNNVSVKINLLPSGSVTSTINPLLLALGAGRGPDVVLGLAYNYPVEYAMRNSLYDISQFDDFGEITSRFEDALMIPYRFEGGVYALPQTMSFRAVYYRTDIFTRLGLTVPNTWEELYTKLLPSLNQNNMTMYIPQIIDPFLYQLGGSYYRDNGTVSNLDTVEGFRAFDEFCKLYTDYAVPVAEDFYSRFRTGEIPIGMTDAGMYLKFSYAAPEIAGCFAMTPIPAHISEDGTYDRTNSGLAVDSCIIINSCKSPETAWSFLKWWTSAEVQKNYSAQVESRLGSSARWLSANSEAFWSLSWSREDRKAIESAFEWAVETPVVRGGYFTNRHLVNAINSAVVQRESPRTSLEDAVEAINKELARRSKKKQ